MTTTHPPSNTPGELPVSIGDELRNSYLDYAMSVIIGRAIPDVRDGLKPVHRRILYAMEGLNLQSNSAYKKCAAVVGEVLGKYHPHGDASVYDALVRMAQDFSMRHPLVDGQGNFGSVDGDPPAAYRYTESRLSSIASELLTDIYKDTVEWKPTFDESRTEPLVLPARYPNLLVNGSSGIAVGMATNVPPHNLREVLDATIHLIRTPDATVLDMMRFIPGPDFPTAGLIYGRAGILQAYQTGRGSITMRARNIVEDIKGTEREQLVFIELPFQVNKARLCAKIGSLIRDKRVEGIKEVRDESDREGMRLVVELKKDVFPQVVLNQLYTLTDLQATFGVINLSLVNNRPETLNLLDTLQHFVDHRREVVSRRTHYDLTQAEARREIVEGLGMVTTETDLVIRTIRESHDPEEARDRLMKLPLKGLEEFVIRAGQAPDPERTGDYFLSERQAKAILEMRLARLTGLEQEKLAQEYSELCTEIARLSAILADEGKLMALIIEELTELREKFGEDRRTEILDNEAEILLEDLIQEEQMVVTISHGGYIKRTPLSTYRAQKRGGKGNRGTEAREDDFISQLFICSTHSFVFFFSDRGKVYVKKVYEVPVSARGGQGRAIVNFVGMEAEERIAAITPIVGFNEGVFVTTLTRSGQIKKTSVIDYQNYRDKGIIGVKINDDDQLLAAAATDGSRELLIATKNGKCIRFDEQQVRPMGRSAMGVKAIELDDDDQVVGFAITDPDRKQVLAVCERGYGKRTELEEFRQQRRGGKGIILIDTSERNGPVVGLALVNEKDEVMLVTNRGQTIRTRVDEIRLTGRNAQGVRVMNVDADERVVAIEPVGERDEEDVVSTSGEKLESASTDDAEPSDSDAIDPSDDDTASTSNGVMHDDEPADDASDSEPSDEDEGSDEDET